MSVFIMELSNNPAHTVTFFVFVGLSRGKLCSTNTQPSQHSSIKYKRQHLPPESCCYVVWSNKEIKEPFQGFKNAASFHHSAKRLFALTGHNTVNLFQLGTLPTERERDAIRTISLTRRFIFPPLKDFICESTERVHSERRTTATFS